MAEAQRTPPSSPRAPRIQQQSWDDCGTPPIDIFDPNIHSPPASPSYHRFDPPKSPKTVRKLPNLDHLSKKANRKFETSNSEPCSSYYADGERSPLPQRMQHKGSSLGETNSPIIRSPHKQQAFVYDAISPKFESSNMERLFCRYDTNQ